MSRSIYALNGLLLDGQGIPLPHDPGIFYPGGDISSFDKAVMLGWYESINHFRSVDETTGVDDGVGQQQNKVLDDSVRLGAWVDAKLTGDRWDRQTRPSGSWTEI